MDEGRCPDDGRRPATDLSRTVAMDDGRQAAIDTTQTTGDRWRTTDDRGSASALLRRLLARLSARGVGLDGPAGDDLQRSEEAEAAVVQEDPAADRSAARGHPCEQHGAQPAEERARPSTGGAWPKAVRCGWMGGQAHGWVRGLVGFAAGSDAQLQGLSSAPHIWACARLMVKRRQAPWSGGQLGGCLVHGPWSVV